MAKVIKFPIQEEPTKIGFRRVRKRKRVNLEDYGQLNLFTQQAKIVSIHSGGSNFERALELDEQGDQLAKTYYQKAIEQGDNLADAYCNLGILESQENSANAIDCFTKCLKEDPRHYEAHYNLANIYSEEGNLSLAKIHYQMAIQIEPEFSSAYYNLGLIMAMREEYQEAIDMLTRYKMMAEDDQQINADKLIISLRKTLNQ